MKTDSISLNVLQEAQAIEDLANLIYSNSMRAFMESVIQVYGRVEKFKKELDERRKQNRSHDPFMRVHEIITLHGRRGAGKSTFLLSALKALAGEDKSSIDKLFEKTSPRLNPGMKKLSASIPKIKSLGIIDPTLMGEEEKLLVTVLTRIRDAVIQHRDNSPIGTQCGDYSMDRDFDEWYDMLNSLAKGISFFMDSNPLKTEEWMDSQHAFTMRLENIQHGADLERDFHLFVNKSLERIGKEAFILAIDDVDTRPDQGWAVLESLRCFFTTPQIITVISGDLDLYSSIVKMKQLEFFARLEQGENNQQKGSGVRNKQNDRNTRIEGLVDQYLIKLLTTRNRIIIPYFLQCINQLGLVDEKIDIYVGDVASPVSLDKLLQTLYEFLGIYHKDYQELVRSTILDRSCRSVMQLLSALYIAREARNKLGGGSEKEVEETERQDIIDIIKGDRNKCTDYKDIRMSFLHRFMDIYLNSLQRIGYVNPHEEMQYTASPKAIVDLLEKLADKRCLESEISLLPTMDNSWINRAVIVIGVYFTWAMRENPSLIIHYMFKVALLQEHISMQKQRDGGQSRDDYKRLHSFLHLDDNASLTVTAGRMMGVVGPSIKKTAEKLFKSKKEISNGPNDKNERAILRMLPVVRLAWGGASYFCSVFSLIGLMGDILTKKTQSEIDLLLWRHSQPYIYPVMYDSKENVTTARVELAHEEEFEEIPDDRYLAKLSEPLDQWKIFWESCWCVMPTHLCSRIISRFIRNLRKIYLIENFETDGTDITRGYLHRCIIAFLNSVLVASCELSARNELKTLDLRNPVTADGIFDNNIQKCKDKLDEIYNKNGKSDGTNLFIDNLPFFSMVLSFPVWFSFLNPYCKISRTVEYVYHKKIKTKQETERSKRDELVAVLNEYLEKYNVYYCTDDQRKAAREEVSRILTKRGSASLDPIDQEWLKRHPLPITPMSPPNPGSPKSKGSKNPRTPEKS